MSRSKLPMINSLGELRRKASDGGPLAERYVQLAMIAARNLGGSPRDLNGALRHLNNEADAIGDDEGVVGEVNFVRDIEARG